MYKAKIDEGLSKFLAFLREEHERERLAEIERQRPIGTQVMRCFVALLQNCPFLCEKVGSYLEYRCKADSKRIEKDANGMTCTDNRCWIRTAHSIHQVDNTQPHNT